MGVAEGGEPGGQGEGYGEPVREADDGIRDEARFERVPFLVVVAALFRRRETALLGFEVIRIGG
jgi:hypothetical protein